MAAGIAIGGRFNLKQCGVLLSTDTDRHVLNVFLVLMFILFVIIYFLVRTFVATMNMPAKVAEYRQMKRERDSNKALREALKALFEGRFGHAEKSALKAVELPENAALSALIGARAAHHMGQFERRNAWFTRIEEDQAHKTARLVTMTELYVDEHKAEQALDAVLRIECRGKRHIQVCVGP